MRDIILIGSDHQKGQEEKWDDAKERGGKEVINGVGGSLYIFIVNLGVFAIDGWVIDSDEVKDRVVGVR